MLENPTRLKLQPLKDDLAVASKILKEARDKNYPKNINDGLRKRLDKAGAFLKQTNDQLKDREKQQAKPKPSQFKPPQRTRPKSGGARLATQEKLLKVEIPKVTIGVVMPQRSLEVREARRQLQNFLLLLKQREAGANVRIRIFRSAEQAVRSQSKAGARLSAIVDRSAFDKPESQIELLRALGKLNEKELQVLNTIRVAILSKIGDGLKQDEKKLSTSELEALKQSEREWAKELVRVIRELQLPAPAPYVLTLSSGQIFAANGLNEITFEHASFTNLKQFIGDDARSAEKAQTLVSELTGRNEFLQAITGVNLPQRLTLSGKEPRSVVVSWNAFLENKQSISTEVREAKGITPILVVTAVNREIAEIQDKNEQKARFLSENPDAAVFGNNIIIAQGLKNLSTIQAGYQDAVGAHFIVVGKENEFNLDVQVKNDEKQRAQLLTWSEEQGPAVGIVKAATILVHDLADLANLPAFLKRLSNGAFLYLPKAAPVQWTIWMQAVKNAMRSIGSAA